MKVLQAYRYEMDPNDRQRTLLFRHAGTARFAYNWGLARRIERFEKNEGKAKFTSAVEQHRELNALKRTEIPWMYDVSKCAPQEALRDLDRAFRNFWRERKKGNRKAGFPKFKKRGLCDRFRLTGSLNVAPQHMILPRIGEVRTKEGTEKFKGRILSATVSRAADRWFVSLQVERERPDPASAQGPAVGIDLGLNCFAVLSDGTRIESPRPLEKALRLLKRRSRSHSRKVKGSANRRKSALVLARLHRRISNIRKDFLHKATTMLAKTKSAIFVEDLNVRGMVRNRSLSKAISDSGWSEFGRMLGYKCPWHGSRLVAIDPFEPSTRKCSRCGLVGPKVLLSERTFMCAGCGHSEDRDDNASKNILASGLEKLRTASSAGIDACGDPSGGGTGHGSRSTSCGSMKQEANATVPQGING